MLRCQCPSVCDGSALKVSNADPTLPRIAATVLLAVLLAGGSSRAMLASARVSCYFATESDAKYCDEHVCLSVCSHITETTRPNFADFLCLLTVAMDQSQYVTCIRFCV